MIQYFIVVLYLIASLYSQEMIQLHPDLPWTQTSAANVNQFYKMHIQNKKTTSQWNLFFVVQQADNFFWQKTELEIYTLNNKNQTTFSIDCIQIGIDACFINAKQILQNQTIYARVKCFENCKYKINTYWSQSYPIHPNKTLLIDFQQIAYSKIFTLNLTNIKFKQLRIILKAQNFLESTAPIKLYANYGNKTPTTFSSDMKGIHLWDDGQGIFLLKQSMKEQFLTLLIMGPAHNKVRLQTHLINDFSNNLQFQKPFFDYLNKSHNRTYVLNYKKMKQINDIFIKVTTFSGSLQVQLFNDKNLTQKILMNIFGINGQLQFKFSKEHRKLLNDTLQFYVLVKSANVQSTYLINAWANTDNIIKLISDVSFHSELYPQQIQNYYIKIFRSSQNKQDLIESIQLTHKDNLQFTPKISICQNQKNCGPNIQQYINNSLKYDSIKPSKVSKTGDSIIYTLKLQNSLLKKTNQSSLMEITLLIILYNNKPINIGNHNKISQDSIITENQKIPIIYSIKYVQKGHMKNLKQNIPEIERISLGELKFYKFINLNKDIQKIKIHLIEISGNSNFQVFRKDPRYRQENNQISLQPFQNTIQIFQKIDQPIYVTVYGKQNSFFSLIIQPIRSIIINNDNNSTQKDHFNFITLGKNLQYKFTMGPNQTQIVQIPPIKDVNYYQIIFQYIQKPQLCVTYLKYPKYPNCQFIIEQKQYKISRTSINIYIGITNPFNKNIVVKIKYTQLYGCQQKKTGEVWNKFLQQPISYCVNYLLTTVDQIQTVISLDNQKYNNLKASIHLNDKQFFITSSYIYLSKQTIEQACKTVGPCNLLISVYTNEKTKIRIVAQYLKDQITLLDGIAQIMHGRLKQNNYKRHKFQIVNFQNITIIIQNKIGSFDFFIKIQNSVTMKQNATNLYPSQNDYHLKSQHTFFSDFNYLIIKESDIKSHCQDLPCIILIAVKDIEIENSISSYGSYIIQATQQFRFLKQHIPALNYLQQNSIAFYSYYYPKQNGTLIISISDQNKQCVNVYLAKGQNVRASKINYIKKNNGNQIIYTQAKKGMYSITVQSLENCMYKISASSKDLKIYEVTKQSFQDIVLKQNQVVYIYYYHYINSSFKILCLQQYGEIMIYGNITSIDSIDDISVEYEKYLNKFSWQGKKNYLKVDVQDSNYKINSYYLFAIKGLKKTQASLIINHNGTQIPLNNKKFVTDFLYKNQTIHYKIFQFNPQVDLSILVHYGEIQVTVYQSKQNFTKTFKTSKQIEIWAVKPKKTIFFMLNLNISIKGLTQSSLYQLSVISKQLSVEEAPIKKLKAGLPTYLYLEKNVSKCISGTIQQKSHELIITVPYFQKAQLNQLLISGKISDKIVTKFQKKIVDNVMTLAFDMTSFFIHKSQQYKICFKHKNFISLTIVAVGSITLLPEKTSIFIQKQRNLTFYSKGKLILQIFQCQQNATVLLSSKYDKIGGTESEISHWKRFGKNYIIQFDHSGLVYLNVKGSKTLIKWNHINEKDIQGLGYYLFKTSNYNYTYSNFILKVKVQSLTSLITNNKIKCKSIKYTIFLTSLQRILKSISQCGIGSALNLSKLETRPDQPDSAFEFYFNANQIDQFYNNSQKIFLSVIAEVELETVSKQIQNYKFIYDTIQINWKSLKAQNLVVVPQRDNHNLKILQYIGIGLIISLLVIYCLRQLIKVTLKYRNRTLLQSLDTQRQAPHKQFKDEQNV